MITNILLVIILILVIRNTMNINYIVKLAKPVKKVTKKTVIIKNDKLLGNLTGKYSHRKSPQGTSLVVECKNKEILYNRKATDKDIKTLIKAGYLQEEQIVKKG